MGLPPSKRWQYCLVYSRQMLRWPIRVKHRKWSSTPTTAFASSAGAAAHGVRQPQGGRANHSSSGKERQFNPRFMALASHYLFEPVACTPASGWRRKSRIRVGNIREWLFTPAALASLTDLNDWLALRCRELASRKHPESDRSIASVFTEEQSAFLPSAIIPFDGYVEEMARVSNTRLIRLGLQLRYSVPVASKGKAHQVLGVAPTRCALCLSGK